MNDKKATCEETYLGRTNVWDAGNRIVQTPHIYAAEQASPRKLPFSSTCPSSVSRNSTAAPRGARATLNIGSDDESYASLQVQGGCASGETLVLRDTRATPFLSIAELHAFRRNLIDVCDESFQMYSQRSMPAVLLFMILPPCAVYVRPDVARVIYRMM